MAVRALDTLIAIKTVSLFPGLNANDRRVATTLLEHYNRVTGQCDPGLDRIAGLLSISERTVIRCNHRLERAGLFRKVRHGGHGNRNSYEPVWSRFQEYEVAWRSKFSRNPKPQPTTLSPATRQSCHLQGDTRVTQTYRSNLTQLTCSGGHPKKEKGSSAFPLRSAAPSSKPSSDAARDEAERRWNTDLNREYGSMPITYAQVIEAMTPEMQTTATDAELRHRGSGIEYIRRTLKLGEGP